MSDNAVTNQCKTLYIGDLPSWVDEAYIFSLFSMTGDISVKLIRNKVTGQSEGYGFIEFPNNAAAQQLLNTRSGSVLPGTDHTYKLNWAAYGLGKFISEDFSVFVGDLAPEVNESTLMQQFQQVFPSVKGAKVITDANSGRSKGYGFVRFSSEDERNQALESMNGKYISGRAIRVSVATQKKSQPQQQVKNKLESTDKTNTTVFVGGLSSSVTDEQLHNEFQKFGEITYTRIPPGKGCGFVQFTTRKCAETALKEMEGQVIGGNVVRLSWGKSSKASGSKVPFPMSKLGLFDPNFHTIPYGTDPYGRALYGGLIPTDLQPFAYAYGMSPHFNPHMAMQQAAGKVYNPLQVMDVEKLNERYVNTYTNGVLCNSLNNYLRS